MATTVTISIIAAFLLNFARHKFNQSHYGQKSKASEGHETQNGKPDYSTTTTKTKVVMKNIVLLGVLALMFCLTEVTLTYFLPNAATDFEVWLKYFMAKDKTYDTMFFLFSLYGFWKSEGVEKAMACFLVLVTGGSFIDKVIFDLNQFLLSDIALITIAIILSIYLYQKRWKTSKISKHG